MAVPSPSSSADKSTRRAAARSARAAYVAGLAADRRSALQADLARHLAPLLDKARTIGAYVAIGSEIDLAPALAGRIVAYPAFVAGQEKFLFRDGPPVATGPHGIPQPADDAPPVIPDLVLVPLLAIDSAGHRLGQGGGHYDRVLPALRAAGARLVGCGWPVQRLDHLLTPEPWDIALDAFASPLGMEIFP